MRCLIVDDDEMSRKSLAHFCSKIDGIEVLEQCKDGIQAMEAIDRLELDLIFLDIEMPDLSGMEMVKSLENLPQIIFTTNRTDYALEAFEYDITDYLTKPIMLPRLIKAIKKAKNRLNDGGPSINSDDLYFRSEGKLVKLKGVDILYIETLDDYLLIHTRTGEKHITHSTLSKMDDKLKGRTFLKVHRSYIINLAEISSIEDTHVLLGKKIIPVSRAHRSILLEKVNLL